MSTYTKPLFANIQGHSVFLKNLPSATAFNFIFVIGIALTFCVMGLTLAAKNYTFTKTD